MSFPPNGFDQKEVHCGHCSGLYGDLDRVGDRLCRRALYLLTVWVCICPGLERRTQGFNTLCCLSVLVMPMHTDLCSLVWFLLTSEQIAGYFLTQLLNIKYTFPHTCETGLKH